MLAQPMLVTMIMLLLTETISASCPSSTGCGNLTIPFPFGTSSDCSIDDSFLITCNHTYSPPKAFLNSGTIEVLDISLDGLIKVASPVASDCYDHSGTKTNGTISELSLSKFPISSALNKFIAVGCDTYALVRGSKGWKQMSGRCVSWCDSIDRVVNGSCSGIGCCQTSIPKGVKDFMVDIRSFRNHTMVNSFNPCGYAFVVETEAFNFSSSDLKNLQMRKTVPVVLDWSIGNLTCSETWKNRSSFACRATHSLCTDSILEVGYHCKCLTGFQGNPYVVDGCQDIIIRSLEDGSDCVPKSQNNGSIMFYISSGLMVTAVGSSWIFWRGKQKKVVKLRQTLFNRNGGELLKTMLSSEDSLSIFTAQDLKKATDNYDENNAIHRESHLGITFKGILPVGNRIVTINQCNAFQQCDIVVVISKLVSLSKIDHGNVVKLMGCCLETQLPLVVYESITVETLLDYLNDDDLARSLSWNIRLKIAVETAMAIAYVHSFGTVPLIHGNLRSSSIQLLPDYTVKVQDFALICFRSECSCVHSYVESSGHLDPEISGSGRLTEKSDVYSFGLVLAELLTGNNVMSPEWQQGEGNLAQYFSCSSRQADLLEILDRRMVTDHQFGEITKVIEIAKRCLSTSSPERPTMKQVAVALEHVINGNAPLFTGAGGGGGGHGQPNIIATGSRARFNSGSVYFQNRDPASTIRERKNMDIKVKKAETFSYLSNDEGQGEKLRKEASLSLDEFNRRVEAFIKKFSEEMRLQRQVSLNQYKEMINAGSNMIC